MKILIIDDEEEIRSIIRLALERLDGMTVCEVSGGLEGLTAAREERPDAILLDVKTWGMEGSEVLKALRDNPETAAIPVIITSGFNVRTLEAESPERTEYVLAKPFAASQLLQQVAAILDA